MAKGTIILNFVGMPSEFKNGNFEDMRSEFFDIIELECSLRFNELRSLCLKKGNRMVYFFEINRKIK